MFGTACINKLNLLFSSQNHKNSMCLTWSNFDMGDLLRSFSSEDKTFWKDSSWFVGQLAILQVVWMLQYSWWLLTRSPVYFRVHQPLTWSFHTTFTFLYLLVHLQDKDLMSKTINGVIYRNHTLKFHHILVLRYKNCTLFVDTRLSPICIYRFPLKKSIAIYLEGFYPSK